MTLDEAIQEFEFDCKIRHLSPKTIDNYWNRISVRFSDIWHKIQVQMNLHDRHADQELRRSSEVIMIPFPLRHFNFILTNAR